MAEKHPSGRIDGATLSCQECRRSWSEPGERWRVYLSDDDPPIAVAYCPGCAEREFGQEAGPAA